MSSRPKILPPLVPSLLHNNFLSRDSFYYCSKNAYLNRVQHRQTDRHTHARDEHRMSSFDDVIVRDWKDENVVFFKDENCLDVFERN